MNCKNCGYEIKEDNQPKGFCSTGCKQAYREVLEWTLDHAAQEFGREMGHL